MGYAHGDEPDEARYVGRVLDHQRKRNESFRSTLQSNPGLLLRLNVAVSGGATKCCSFRMRPLAPRDPDQRLHGGSETQTFKREKTILPTSSYEIRGSLFIIMVIITPAFLSLIMLKNFQLVRFLRKSAE